MQNSSVEIRSESRGRALFIDGDGRFYIAVGYRILRSDDQGRSWTLDCEVPGRGWKPWVARNVLAARFLRFYIQAFQVLADGSRIAVARDGIYRAAPGEFRMERTWALPRGSRPINLSADGNVVLFGEYGELDHVAVRLYRSGDSGRTFDVFHEFPKGDVHHVHNVVVDGHSDNYWVLAGDHGRTSGIASIAKDGSSFVWVDRGSQMVRAVDVLTRPDCLIYGSDSELENNYIVRLDKRTGRHERILPIDGSSLYCVDFGKYGLISTCVEPSAVNFSRCAALYGSRTDSGWEKMFELPKDVWHNVAFQFGLIVLPHVVRGGIPGRLGMMSGQALAKYHDRVSLFEIQTAAQE